MSDGPDFAAVTATQQEVWSEGDFAMVANLITKVAEDLAEAAGIVTDERVIDVACGSGNAAISAARRAWGNTVGVDFVPELLERGRERAAAERLDVEFVEGDAQALPVEDGSFDVALSVFGAMFAPDQEQTAAELLRVVRPGGRIAMANWTPDGSVGKMFMTLASHVPPPPGVRPPLLWGNEDWLRETFGDGISELRTEVRKARQTFRSPDHFIEFFRTYFGPIKTAFEKVGPEGEQALTADLRTYLEEANTTDPDRALVTESEYLQVLATRA